MSGPDKSVDADGHIRLFIELNKLAEQPESSVKGLSEAISDIILEEKGVALAAVLLKPRELNQLSLAGFKSIKPIHLSNPLHLVLDRDWFYGEKDYLLFGSDLDVKQAARYLNWSVEQLGRNDEQLGLESVYITKLTSRGHHIGVLAIGLKDKANLDHAAVRSIEAAKGLIATLLASLINEQESHYSNRKLQEYTSKLATLDEVKDDFISMASHQLRTPLTSVKGYISMILENDAGHINEEQRKMLAQAFASCQRMVYIISDMLNVSRLNTGKFVMDLSPVNLDFIIKDEISMLKEVAKSMGVKITYTPNPDMPAISLDETKIRQVIMNFIDNALYYTPAGGEINIKLEDRPSSVELRVKDNGMGVPRSEQRHLFTKFYRATNARKARPDGTGLGLFMAKKVVIGLNGAIIFESVEGRGSTFGFIFPKSTQQ